MLTESIAIAFGLVLRRARSARGLTQIDFAERCDVSRSYMSALENGRENPTLETLTRIAEALDQPLSDLIRAAEEIR